MVGFTHGDRSADGPTTEPVDVDADTSGPGEQGTWVSRDEPPDGPVETPVHTPLGEPARAAGGAENIKQTWDAIKGGQNTIYVDVAGGTPEPWADRIV